MPVLVFFQFASQGTKPVAAKLYESTKNASYQANATRDAAQQALKAAQAKLAHLRSNLVDVSSKKQAAMGAMAVVPVQLGVAQFKVGFECITGAVISAFFEPLVSSLALTGWCSLPT